jgi:rhodanese-related sulfurtransferase
VNPESESFRFPRRAHRWAAAGVLVLGLILAALPDRKASLLGAAADPAYQSKHPVERITADELAFHIMDGDARVLPVDVRDGAEFARTSLPRAVNILPEAMLGKEWRDVLSQERDRKVFFAQDEAAALRAATLAGMLGYRNVAVLEGGLDRFNRTILQATAAREGVTEADPVTSRFIQFTALSAEEMREIIEGCGGVGEIGSFVYNIDGEPCGKEFAERVIGLNLDEIHRIPFRIGVAASAEKALPIYGALRGGYLHVLITDEAAAQGVLEIFAKNFQKSS